MSSESDASSASSTEESDYESQRLEAGSHIQEFEEEYFENDLEPVATAEEAEAYAKYTEFELQQQEINKRRYNGEISLDSWLVLVFFVYLVSDGCNLVFCVRF